MSRESPQFKLRMPEDLHSQVSEAAGEAGRSMNAEIVYRLERSFAAVGHDRAHSTQSAQLGDALSALEKIMTEQDASIRTLAGLLEVVVSKLGDSGDSFARDVKKDLREFARLIKAGDVASAYRNPGARLRTKSRS